MDLRIEQPDTTSPLRVAETDLVDRMNTIFPAATVNDLIDLCTEAQDLPAQLREAGREWMRFAHEREAWTVRYMDFCLRRYGAGPLHGELVLEAGCGSGGAAPHLARRFDHVVGIDPDLPALLVAAKRLEQLDARERVTLVAATIEQQVLATGSCDAVKCTDVIEHVGDPVRAAMVMDSVMRPGGAAFVLTPNRWSVLTTEPHVRLWGVNLMPRKLAGAYVQRRLGLRYSDTARLLSVGELLRVLRRTGADAISIVPIEDKHLNPDTKRGRKLKHAFMRPPLKWLSSGLRPIQPTLEAVWIRRAAP